MEITASKDQKMVYIELLLFLYLVIRKQIFKKTHLGYQGYLTDRNPEKIITYF